MFYAKNPTLHDKQWSAVPEQVLQFESQGKQLLFDKNDPSGHVSKHYIS